MMYSEQDFKDIAKQLKTVIILLIAGLIFFIFISILVANLVTNRAGMIIMVLGVCIEVFILGMYATPIFAYYRFIKDLVMGRSRQINGLVRSVSDRPIYKDNKLYFYEVTIEEDEVERVLLWDQQKDWPPINVNRHYSFQIHENFIKDLKQIG